MPSVLVESDEIRLIWITFFFKTMINNNQPLCAIISRRRYTNIDKSIPSDKSENDKNHICQNNNSDARDFEHRAHEHEHSHGHFNEPALVADDHFHPYIHPNHANKDQAKVTNPRYGTIILIINMTTIMTRRQV